MRNSPERLVGIGKKPFGVALTCAMVICAFGSDQGTARHHAVAHQPAPPMVAPPTAPPTLQQEPTQPPQVTYSDGQLAINAPNCTLVDILRAIRAQTGAVMDVPGNPNDRVVGHFGPGPARDVMAALLNGSRYNYVLLGSATNPDVLEHVILSAQMGGGETAAPQPQPPPQAAPAQTQLQPTGLFGDAEQTDEMGTISNGNTDAEQPPDVDQQPDEQAAQSDDNSVQPTPPGGVRSPQQLLQELQQRQQQGGQNGPVFQPGAGAPPPGSQQ